MTDIRFDPKMVSRLEPSKLLGAILNFASGAKTAVFSMAERGLSSITGGRLGGAPINRLASTVKEATKNQDLDVIMRRTKEAFVQLYNNPETRDAACGAMAGLVCKIQKDA